jgi:hypothetical protein
MIKACVQHEKVTLIVFFDHKGAVHHKHIPHDLLMNQHFDIQVTSKFTNKIQMQMQHIPKNSIQARRPSHSLDTAPCFSFDT